MKKKKAPKKYMPKPKLTEEERQEILSYSWIAKLVEENPQDFENLTDAQLIKMRETTEAFKKLYPEDMPEE